MFLIPQSSAPFKYSGQPRLVTGPGDTEYDRFVTRTGIILGPSNGIDTSYYDKGWKHRPAPTEVVLADFTDPTVLRTHRASSRLLPFAPPDTVALLREQRRSH